MSLINEALKKAQRQRTNNPFGVTPPMPGSGGGGRVARRGSGMSPQTILLIVAGCAVLIVISAVGAVFFVNGKSTPKAQSSATAVALAPVPSPNPSATIASPTIALPTLSLPPKTESVTAAPLTPTAPPITAEKKPEPSTSAAAKTAATADSKTAEVKPVSGPSATSRTPDERVHVYLDDLRVTAVRVAGAGSRVRLNDKVYRINDIVDRGLSLKLTAVENDSLTFTDANGVEYQKNY